MSKDAKKYEKLLKIWKSYSLSERFKYNMNFTFGNRALLNKNVVHFLSMRRDNRRDRFRHIGASIKSFFSRVLTKVLKKLNGSGISEDFNDKTTSVTTKASNISKKVFDAFTDVYNANLAIDEEVKSIRKSIKHSTNNTELQQVNECIDAAADKLISNGLTDSKEAIVKEIRTSVKEKYDEKKKEIEKKASKERKKAEDKLSPIEYYSIKNIKKLMDETTKAQEAEAKDPMNNIKEDNTVINIGMDKDNNMLSIKHNDDTLIAIPKRFEDDNLIKASKDLYHNIKNSIESAEDIFTSSLPKEKPHHSEYWVDDKGLLRHDQAVVIQSRKLSTEERKKNMMERVGA